MKYFLFIELVVICLKAIKLCLKPSSPEAVKEQTILLVMCKFSERLIK